MQRGLSASAWPLHLQFCISAPIVLHLQDSVGIESTGRSDLRVRRQMDDRRRSDLDLGASTSCRRGSGEASAAAGTGTDTPSAWTGEKKPKIQISTPASGSGDIGKVAIAKDDDEGHSSGKIIVREQERGSQQLEGIDWDQAKPDEKIDCYLQQLQCDLPESNNDDFWFHFDDKQRRELNERLALCRIRAHKIKNYCKMDDANLKAIYPANVLEGAEYYKFYEVKFEWYFDPQYCNYPRLQDYQRLLLRNNGEYEDWDEYRQTCSTLEGDKAFVELWERLLSNTKLIEFFLTDTSCKRLKIESLVFYHMLKIAAERSCIFQSVIHFGFLEFMWSVRYDNTWYKYYVGLFGDIWKRVAKQKMNFKEALKEVYYQGKYTLCKSEWKTEFESDNPNPGPMEHLYNTHLVHIDGKAEEGAAYQLILEAVKKFIPKPKIYYDYAKKKLGIAKEIGLIDSCESST